MPPPARPASGAKGAVTTVEAERWERAVARRSAESRATVPHLELDIEVELSIAPEAPGVGALVLWACAQALREHPRANASYRDGHFELYERINIGTIVASEKGYVIPTIFEADGKAIATLQDELHALTERAGAGLLSAPELAGATFTFWDAGALGLARAGPVIVPPQAAALACGMPRAPGANSTATVLTLTLSCDHRILYGATAAAFLTRVRDLVQAGSP